MISMIGQKMQLTVFKPDGKPLAPVIYLAKRVKEKPFSLNIDVDITSGSTDTNKPATDKVVKAKVKCKTCGKSLDIDIDFIKEVAPNTHENFQNTLLLLPTYLNKYSANSCKDLVNILAQGKIETGDFKKLRENLNYTKKTFGSPEKINSISPTAIEKGFQRRGMGKYTKKQKLDFIWKNLAENDAAYGFHLYGNEKYPNRDYRGRGLIHLTHFETYEKCAKETGLDIVNNPKLIETDYNVALHTASWYWKDQRNGRLMALTATDSAKINSDSVTESISIIVNGGKIKLEQRIAEKKTIAKIFVKKYGACK